MSDTAQGHVDLDTLTDDQVKAMSSQDIAAMMDQGDGSNNGEDGNAPQGSNDPGSNGDPAPAQEADLSLGSEPKVETSPVDNEEGATPDGQPEIKPDGSLGEVKSKAPTADDTKPKEEKPAGETQDSKTVSDVEKSKEATPEELKAQSDAALDFFDKVSKPFKADGKEVKIRTPEDAIRLMQMGVNYSRRMQEMKPLKAQDQMLKQAGLDTPDKLNFLIDLSKGNPEAIKKLLKDKKIDPIDFDMADDTKPYVAGDYSVDPKDLAFREAIDTTVASEGGPDMIRDINKEWDNVSKEALRDQPAIFENLLAQKQSGVYGRVKAELDHQRSLGYLTDVPFLQGYHQVADAMQKAGFFDTAKEVQSTPTPVEQPKVAIDTGTRKAATPSSTQPNPNLSSTTQPRIAPSGGEQPQQDYSSMSDEDFMKLAPPV